MKRITVLVLTLWSLSVFGQTGIEKDTEITYGRKDGMALTMVVQPPKVASNGKAIIWVVSAGWTSDYTYIHLFKA